MAVNFSGLTRSAKPLTGDDTPAPGLRRGSANGASAQHQFAACAGLTARGRPNPGVMLRVKPPTLALPPAPLRTQPGAEAAPARVELRTPSVPLAPGDGPATPGTVPPRPEAGNSQPPATNATTPGSPRKPINTPVPGERAVFAWLPVQGLSPLDALAACGVERPHFQWARPVTG